MSATRPSVVTRGNLMTMHAFRCRFMVFGMAVLAFAPPFGARAADDSALSFRPRAQQIGSREAVSAPPEKGTFTMGSVEFQTNPGEQFLTGNILHIRNSVGEAGLSELPWGKAITASERVITAQGDITTGIGRSTSETVDVYANGIVLGTVETKLEGVRYWTYLGPELSFRGVTITTGQIFFGLFTTITAMKHGVSGELKGLETKETATGVILINPDGTLGTLTLGYATGTYTWLR